MMRKVRADTWMANPNGDRSIMVRPRWERRVLQHQPPVEDLPHPTAGIYTDRVRCWLVHNYREHLAD
jgi:hypothetical protein